jgi:hypothetical protein
MRIGVDEQRRLVVQYADGEDPHIREVQHDADVRSSRGKVVLVSAMVSESAAPRRLNLVGGVVVRYTLELFVDVVWVEQAGIDPIDTGGSVAVEGDEALHLVSNTDSNVDNQPGSSLRSKIPHGYTPGGDVPSVPAP